MVKEANGEDRVIGFKDIDFASLTDVGIRRSHNQDSFASLPATDLEQWQARGHVFLVADGMGAHAVGELASKLAADGIPHIYSKHAEEGPVAALRKAFVEANLSIHNRGQANKEFEGMGTTAIALVIRPEGAWIGHVGDSRAYRIRAGKIEQLSFDHSLVWELARRQKKNPDELEGVPSNVIIRSMGPEPLVQVDVEGPHPLEPGDAFILCSDGLSGPVEDRQIGAVVSSLPAAEACRLLVHLANLHGGPDNVTAIVVRVQEKQAPESLPEVDLDEGRKWRVPASLKILWWLPWALLSLLFGILLAIGAIYLAYENMGGEIPVFLLSAACLLAGMIGLMVHTAKETKKTEAQAENDSRPLRVYRQTSCVIDQPLIQSLRQTLTSLETRLRDVSWELDWDRYHKLFNRGQELSDRNQFPDSYREYCRAMILLLDAVGFHRNKEEVFRPHWDRAPEKK
jgi:serine/threonine protein phosphatase PrpC